MIAFLKRRWILLSCAIVLLAFSVLIFRNNFSGEHFYVEFHLREGEIFLGMIFGGDYPAPFLPIHKQGLAMTRPEFGGLPACGQGSRLVDDIDWFLSIPIWLPLSVVVGWIVWRELRWREKRARAAELQPRT